MNKGIFEVVFAKEALLIEGREPPFCVERAELASCFVSRKNAVVSRARTVSYDSFLAGIRTVFGLKSRDHELE